MKCKQLIMCFFLLVQHNTHILYSLLISPIHHSFPQFVTHFLNPLYKSLKYFNPICTMFNPIFYYVLTLYCTIYCTMFNPIFYYVLTLYCTLSGIPNSSLISPICHSFLCTLGAKELYDRVHQNVQCFNFFFIWVKKRGMVSLYDTVASILDLIIFWNSTLIQLEPN
jgi:hypothetical protein